MTPDSERSRSPDSEHRAHLEWLGYVQPVGLVVSAPALVDAQAFPNKNILPDHSRFLEVLSELPGEDEGAPIAALLDFPRFATHVLGWEAEDLVGTGDELPDGIPLPPELAVPLPEDGETLRPTYGVRGP